MIKFNHQFVNRIDGIMVSAVHVDHGFEPRSGQTKDYKIGICCFSARHAELNRKSKYRLARKQDNVSEWNTIKIQLIVLF